MSATISVVTSLYRSAPYLEEFYRLLPRITQRVGLVSIEELHAHPRESVERLRPIFTQQLANVASANYCVPPE